ncbi:MAG TPA: four-helix bundle copper-binding protein [Nitrososphaeraceae archaeon]
MTTTETLQNSKYQSCIDVCNTCAEACEYCATCDLREEDVKMMASCVQINRDCANICWTASQFMSRDSKYAIQLCSLCADICDACAIECEKHTTMDHCQRCAQICRKCAEECRKMIK